MSKCVNVNHPDFLQLVEETGINPIVLSAKMGVWMEKNDTDEWPSAQQLGIPFVKPIGNQDNIQYQFKSITILLSDRAKQIFDKGKKANWTLDKILNELAIPKDQRDILLGLGISDRKELAIQLASSYGFVVNVQTATKGEDTSYKSLPIFFTNGNREFSKVFDKYFVKEGDKERIEIPIDVFEDEQERWAETNQTSGNEVPTQFYSNLTQPGGTNYTENRIITPNIVPSIKGHPQFAEDNDIGWFRSDERLLSNTENDELAGELAELHGGSREEYVQHYDSNTRRILEIQSDLFQKGRDLDDLVTKHTKSSLDSFSTQMSNLNRALDEEHITYEEYKKERDILEANQKLGDRFKKIPDNQFLQLLNKDNNWVTFFIKSIIQDSVNKGYEKVLFPRGETAAKIEGHETIANEIKSINDIIGDREKNIKTKTDFIIDTNRLVRDGKVTKSSVIDNIDKWQKEIYFDEIDIKELEEKKKNLKSQGIEKLKPIEAFYEIRITNTLKKLYPTNNIVDEYGNEWTEVTITPQIASNIIELQKSSDVFGTPVDIKDPLTESRIDRQISNLKDAFAKVGVTVEVSVNENINESARVQNKKIEYNPNKLREDSIFHEHGHILVDLVADRDFINSGIDQLRGTKLWNDVAILYSEYDDTQLGKEVLTTAIGLNARDQFNDAQLPLWKFWYNRFMDRVVAILNQLGILHSPLESKDYEKPLAIRLARELTSGNITIKLNNSLTIHNNQQRDASTKKFIKDFEKYLTVRKNGLKTIFQKYGSTGSTAYVKRATERYEELELIDSINENNFHSAIEVGMKQLDNDVIDVAALETKLNELKLNYLDKDVKLKDLSVKDRTTFFEAMRGTSIFLQGYTAIKNFGTLNEQDIATLPESDKAKYKEMSDFVFAKQAELLPRIAALESTYDSLKPLHLEWQLQYTSNPKILESSLDLADILDELTYDESKLQLLFDSAVYSNDPLLANMAKMVHLEQGLSEDEADLLKRKYLSARAKLNGYKDTELADKIYDDNGQLIQQYDRIRFFSDLEKHLSSFKAGTKAYEKARIAFYQANTEFKTKEDGSKYTIEEIQAIATNKKEELNTADYTRWLNKQFKYSRFADLEGYYKYTSEFIVPTASYTNTDYSDIQNNKELGDYYNTIKEIMTEATSAYHYSPQSDGYLPNIVDKARKYGSEHDEQVDMVDEDGNTLYHIPIKYTGLANAKPTITFRKRLTGEDYNDYENDILKTLERRGKIKANQFKNIKEIYAHNKTIEEGNKKAHGEAASRKLDTVIPLFIDSAMQYKHRKAIEDGLLLSLAQLRDQRVKKLDYKGNTKKQKGVDLANNPLDATFSGVESNTYRHAAAFMKMVFYDKYVDKKTGDEALRILKEYTSILGMGFNIFAAVKNVTMGGYMTTAESMAGLHFTPADLNVGAQRYLSAKLSYWSDTSRKDQSSTTLENALVKRFKVIESYDNQFELQDAEISKSFAKRMYIDAAFFLQHEGEHMMQNTTMFTLLESHRLIDGKAMSYQDYLNGKLKVLSPKMDKAAADAILASNEEVRKSAKEKFDTYPQMKDLYELSEDGHAQIKAEYDDKFSKEDEVLFREEIKGVNHKIHGIYNKSHKGTANQSMLWQSVLQFRNWVRPGWNKRFGTRGGVFTDQQFWNENRNEIDTGSYSNLMKLLAKPITQNSKANRSSDEERTAFVALQNILKDYGDMMVNMKYYWHQMSDTEKAAAKSAITELAVLAALMLLSNLLRGLLKDKDWAKNNRYTNFLLYQLSASVTEMWTFVPVYGWFMEGSKILTNPNATYGFALNTLKLTSAAMQYPFIDDEKRYFQGGVNNKKLKVGVYASRDLPMFNVYQRIMQLDTQTKAYNMFGAVGGSSNN